LRRRLEATAPERLAALLAQARGCRQALEERLGSAPVSAIIRRALAVYWTCLIAWAEGARLAEVQHPALQGFSLLEQALFLQHDTNGCQTGMYRQADGHVVLWHTEEDADDETGGRFDQLRLAIFQAPGASRPVQIYAFIYPDLLPGPAFAWRSDGYIQAVDLLMLKPCPTAEPRLLANITTWVTLILGTQVATGEVIQTLGPYYDGYALNAVYRQDERIEGSKHEFSYDLVRYQRLDKAHNSLLFQANAFSPGHSNPALQTLEDLTPAQRHVFERREQRAQTALDRVDAQYRANIAPFLAALMTSRRGGRRAYTNKDVKARLIARLGPEQAEVWLDGGPGIPDEPYRVLNYELS
jgi:hypothetical protein